MKPYPRIYIHFADYYHGARARQNLTREAELQRAISTAFRLCLLFAEDVILPASSVFESPDAQSLIKGYDLFRTNGMIRMAAGDASVGDHLESKLSAYDSTTSKHFLESYHRKGRVLPSYVVRPGSSTRSIGRSWLNALEDRAFLQEVRGVFGGPLPTGFETEWSKVPEDLGGKAFVDVHAMSLLNKKGIAVPQLRHLMAPVIEEPYITGYKTSLDAWIMVGIPFLSHDPIESRIVSGKRIPFRDLMSGLSRFGLLDRVLRCKPEHLFALWCRPEWDLLAVAMTSSNVVDDEGAHLAVGLATFLDSLSSDTGKQLEIELIHPMLAPSKPPRETFDAAVVVALPVEAAAMRSLLAGEKKIQVDGDPNLYYSGQLLLPNRKPHSVLVCQLHRMGTNAAATSTTNMMRSFDVGHVIVCGIALGVPRPNDATKHVRLGDVVVSDRAGVIQTDHKVVKAGGEASRSLMQPPPAALVRIVNAIDTDLLMGKLPQWNDLIDQKAKDIPHFARPEATTDVVFASDGNTIIPHPEDPSRDNAHPKFVRAVFGSSNTLVKDGDFRDSQAETHGIQAMEMESAGSLEALWTFEGSAMVVKGVCDYGVNKNDRWHGYAALAAAAVTAYIIAEI